MQYYVVFNIAQAGFRQWWYPTFGLLFVAIGTILMRFRTRLNTRTPKFFPFVFLGFAIFWTCFAFFATAIPYHRLLSAFRNGECDIVEGTVENFHPMPVTGHDEESFDVDHQHFHYSDYIVSPGFNNTSSHGGPIQEGVQVRIHFLGNDIAELEVANK